MSKLADLIKALKEGTSVNNNFSANINTDVEKHNQEFQGIGKKMVVKKGAVMNIDNSTKNVFNITLPDIPKDQKERAKVISELKSIFDNGEICLIGQFAAADIQDYNLNPPSDEVKVALEYLTNIAPEQDVLCMKTGLYVRSLNERGEMERAKRIRDQASNNTRARNIINLASAGFIEGYVAPVCSASGNDAKKVYDEIVEDLPGIVFVNASMGIADAMKIIDEKIKNREKYHWEINSISVNGLNNCLTTIEKVHKEVKKQYPNLETNYTTSVGSGFSKGELKIILA